jgi:hypothetical protein
MHEIIRIKKGNDIDIGGDRCGPLIPVLRLILLGGRVEDGKRKGPLLR